MRYHRLRNRRGSDAFPQQLPGVLCGHVVDPSDAYMFAQINDGNAISLPCKRLWLGRSVIQNIFEKRFEAVNGYPPEKSVK